MTMSPPDPANDASGHRARLRARLIEGGPEALLDHELIEYLLALAIPRKDTKPMARALLAEFGGLGPLLSADAGALARAGLTDGVVAALKIAEASALRLLRTEISQRDVLSNWQALNAYLHADMAHRAVERVRDAREDGAAVDRRIGRLDRDRTAGRGSEAEIVMTRPVFKVGHRFHIVWTTFAKSPNAYDFDSCLRSLV